jgi:hypothetical protein
MAGSTGANPTAVMMELDIIHQRDLKERQSRLYIIEYHRFQAFLFKIEFNCIHPRYSKRTANLREESDAGL